MDQDRECKSSMHLFVSYLSGNYIRIYQNPIKSRRDFDPFYNCNCCFVIHTYVHSEFTLMLLIIKSDKCK